MATTALQLVENAAKKIHILGRGQTLSADEAADGLSVLNAMLGSWSADSVYVYTSARETFSLTGAVSYTIGDGADFNTERPLSISGVFVSQGGIDYPLIAADEVQYNSFDGKDDTAIPEYYYYDNNYPTGRIYFYPKPISAYTATISSQKQLTQFAGLTTVYDMPPMYKKALEFNLAKEWAPNYEKEASATVAREAILSLQAIERYNLKNKNYISYVDPAIAPRGDFDIYRGC